MCYSVMCNTGGADAATAVDNLRARAGLERGGKHPRRHSTGNCSEVSCCVMQLSSRVICFHRVSTAPGNPGNLLEFVWSSWKFLYKMLMICSVKFVDALSQSLSKCYVCCKSTSVMCGTIIDRDCYSFRDKNMKTLKQLVVI